MVCHFFLIYHNLIIILVSIEYLKLHYGFDKRKIIKLPKSLKKFFIGDGKVDIDDMRDKMYCLY